MKKTNISEQAIHGKRWIVPALIGCLMVIVISDLLQADIILYQIPETDSIVQLQGEVTYNAGGTAFYRHPNSAKFKRLIMNQNNIKHRYKAPSLRAKFARKKREATDSESMMEAAMFALKHAMVDKVYQCAEKALEMDSDNVRARKIMELKNRFSKGIQGDSKKEKDHMQGIVKLPMKFATSDHFVLMHDTPATKGYNKLTRSEERLQLLERVYESFLLKFYSSGVELEIPKERLMVVLFNEKNDYDKFAQSLSPSLASAIGFFDPTINMSFFFDHGSSEEFRMLGSVVKQLKREAERVRKGARSGQKFVNGKEIVRLSEVMDMLVLMDQENEDIEVVSHECTHHIAANTGLLPRHVMIPSWLHEGLASYFEAPGDASWAGIGAVNELRLKWYNGLKNQTNRSNIKFIVGNEIFSRAGSHGATLHAYGQSWALTHFMIERHFDEMMMFYRKVGEMPPDLILSSEILNKLFDECVKTDRVTLDREWRQYMNQLKTDVQLIIGNN